MGTEDETEGGGVTVETVVEASVSSDADDATKADAAPEDVSEAPPPADEAVIIKSREHVRRPPLPAPDLYDACIARMRRPRRPVAVSVDPEAPVPEPAPPRDDPRLVALDTLPLSSVDAFAALDAWVEIVPQRKKTR